MATPNLNDMREIVRNEYPGQKWKDKVDKMSDSQVIALYYQFINKVEIKPLSAINKPKNRPIDILNEYQLHFCDPDDLA